MTQRSLTDKVLAWSAGRPGWQRDALRRLATRGFLGGSDIEELATLAEMEAAEAEHQPRASHRERPDLTAMPLAAEHLPVTAAERPGVRLVALSGVRNVNALAYDTELEFGEGRLTVVSGWNGAGKSGYARILERVARSRAPEQPVLPNIYAEREAPPHATIRYKLGQEGETVESPWREGGGPTADELARLAFFDARVAIEHVEKRVDVRYTPTGLDLLADLAEASRQVESVLRRRLRTLGDRQRSWPLVSIGAIGDALAKLGTAEGLGNVRGLASLSGKEIAERETLERQISELRATDPGRRAAEAKVHAGQLDVLARLLRHVGEVLAPDVIAHLVELAADVEALELSAAAASAERFGEEPLAGVGSTEWRAMWTAAAEYSTGRAYPDHEFPHVDGGSCVLCQRPLDMVASERLRRYAAFVASDLEDQRSGRLDELEAVVGTLATLPLDHPGIAGTADLLRVHDEALAGRATAVLDLARNLLARAAEPGENLDELPSQAAKLASAGPGSVADAVAAVADAERAQSSRLAGIDERAAAVDDLAVRRAELGARENLAAILPEVLSEHDRRIDESVVSAAIRSCTTTAITRLATELSATGVDELCAAFEAELERLGIQGVLVSLVSGGGIRGVSYVRVTLPNAIPDAAPMAVVPRVLSEGERRVVALAAFFAEVTVSGDGSAIILDDPVSSLDHRFRRAVAARLVDESERRQVVVFTHDTVFVNDIATSFHEYKLGLRIAGRPEPPPVTYRNVVRTGDGAGIVTEDLGLRNPKVSTRMRVIERRIEEAATLYTAGDEDGYERIARGVLRPLREAWERAVEEVLLHEIVVRHGNRVQTRRLRYVIGITDPEVAGVERGMTVESRFLHDVPVGEEAPVPPPSWLRSEAQALRTWIRRVQERHRGVDRNGRS